MLSYTKILTILHKIQNYNNKKNKKIKKFREKVTAAFLVFKKGVSLPDLPKSRANVPYYIHNKSHLVLFCSPTDTFLTKDTPFSFYFVNL
jgi:hypothetical protein